MSVPSASPGVVPSPHDYNPAPPLNFLFKLLVEIREGVAAGDAARIRRVAHTLKGSAGNFGAVAAVAAADRLERLGRDGDLTAAAAALPPLEEALQQFQPALDRLLVDLSA